MRCMGSKDGICCRVVSILPEIIKMQLATGGFDFGVTVFAKGELPLYSWQKFSMPVKELHDKVASAARQTFMLSVV